MNILMIDLGGTNVKLMATGQDEFRKFPSGHELTPVTMVKQVREMTQDWEYEAVSLGFPGLVRDGRIARNPLNVSDGWLGFNFEKALDRPVRIINDAAMQALGHYVSGRLLFIGLGTSVGACLIADDVVIPIEVGLLRLSKSEDFVARLSKQAMNEDGKARWSKAATSAVTLLQDVFQPDHTVLGGGNAKHLEELPPRCERGDNKDAFNGAVRLWPGTDLLAEPDSSTWKIIRQRKKPIEVLPDAEETSPVAVAI